jgi:PleD family two-component response regulator
MKNQEIQLPTFTHIDTRTGLKYLNGNKSLYLKILNNFLLRYKDIHLLDYTYNEVQDIIHSVKGLSATLGMTSLAQISMELNNDNHIEEKSLIFFNELNKVIDDLEKHLNADKKTSSILIIDDNRENIDELINILDDEYDILLAINKYEAFEVFDTESIDFVIINSKLQNSTGEAVFNFLKKHTQIQEIPMLFSSIEGDYHSQTIKESIGEIRTINPPFQAEELIEHINMSLN